jgi:hypothetical protein
MDSSLTTKNNKVSPSMSITRSLPHRQEKICGLQSSAELKQFDELFKQLVKEASDVPNEVIDTREDAEDEAGSTSDESVSSVNTERKLRRIKRKLFLHAVEASRNQATTRKDAASSAKTRCGRE